MGKYILALDQGTTSSRAILFDSEQNILAIRQHELTQHYPHEDGSSRTRWKSGPRSMQLCSRCWRPPMFLRPMWRASASPTSARRHPVDKNTGRPIHNAIVWQCRRTADIVDRLVQDGLSGHIRRTTGLVPDAYFSGTKIKWLLDHVEGAREKGRARRNPVRHGGFLAGVEADRRQGAHYGRDQCRTHDDLRHSPSGLGRYPA